MSRLKRRFLVSLLIGVCSCLLALGCGLTSWMLNSESVVAKPINLTVSAAASLQDALKAIEPQFRQTHAERSVDYNFGASGALQRQIEQGAPADIFFSAASKQMDALAQKGLILPSSRRNLLTNQLVLIAPKNSSLKITNLAQLKDVPIKHFAVGEFRSVPAGQYAEQVFKKFGLLNTLQPKFVFGNNVRTVLAAVESGNADVGMVYATDAALSNRVKVLITAPARSHDPIVYPIAVLKRSSNPKAAQEFIDFLVTDAAQAVFKKFGFSRF